MSSRRETTESERLLVVKWSKEGKSLREIASLIGVTHSCVQKILQNDGRFKIWREAGKALAPKNTIKRVKFGDGSVLVLGCMLAGGVGELAFIDVFTATVPEGKAIFGGRAAIEFSFGEKERPAQRRSN
ncbi:hypothetical protein TNCV_2573521 [Trichonephila clavipes]|nr:hypothetical protein TNCV_2573521 [Trichonephila clavipes]